MKKNFPFILVAIFIVFFSLVFKYSFAQSNQTINAGSDAIAVRIVPNPNHYSISRWYESQGFTGSPQSLVVDGYEAIRDGRTVYVNAANVDFSNGAKIIYTNIYLISYNQDSVPNTVDILGQIVSHWKFNSNLIESSEPLPSCAISSLSCARDADCGTSQVCATSTSASSSCQLAITKNCLTDTDCPVNFFCDSVKAKITRDLKRVGKLEELKEALFSYKNSSGLYPALAAGSYLAAHTISVWPSWTADFLSNLNIAQTFLDPINRLGACPGYDLKTCWDKDAKAFWGNQNLDPPSGISQLTLPGGSYAFIYQTDHAGSNYNVCAVMESRDLGWHFSPNDPASSACVVGTGINTGGSATNTAPRLVSSSLTGVAGQEFNGSLKVVDDQHNPLVWSLDTSATNWNGWQNNSGNAPILKDTNNADQKKVYALTAGSPGNYNAILTVNDGQGGVLSTTTVINIINPAPAIQAADGEYILDPLLPFAYNFTFSGANIINPASAYSVSKISGPFDLLNSAGIVETMSSAGVAKYKVDYQGIIPLSHQFSQNTNFVYQAVVTDKYNTVATKKFTIHIIVEKPQLGFTCSSATRFNQPYSCFLGSNKQGDHTLAYGSNALPNGLILFIASSSNEFNNNNNASFLNGPSLPGFFKHLFGFVQDAFYQVNIARAIQAGFDNFVGGGSGNTISTSTPSVSVYLKGTPTATSTGWPIAIQALNEYGATNSRAFILKINNYCGDGKLQAPNMEARGGFYNDGYEDCDGAEGVTTDVSLSNIALQYGCMTGVGAQTPPIIPNGNYCVFKSPLAGGGYCGDGYCQLELVTANGTTTLETSATGTPGYCSDCVASFTPLTCANNQHADGTNCVCDSGWYNCDGLSTNGCESSTSCSKCSPQCAGTVCGPDGCGGFCQPNNCPTGQTCKNGQCAPSCTSSCDKVTCGQIDSCTGLQCGCTSPQICAGNGICCQVGANSCSCGPFSNQAYTKCGSSCCANQTSTCCNNTCAPLGSTQCGANCCGPTQACCNNSVCYQKGSSPQNCLAQ